MEDLLEELLSVLAPPSGTGSTHTEVSSTKPLAPGSGDAAQKTQVNGLLTSQKMAPETAVKATEKMGQQTARQSAQTSDQDTSDSAINPGSSTLMMVASLSNLAIDQLLKTAQSSGISADNSRDVAVESLLFDAGVAVPKALGHQIFGPKEGHVHEVVVETDELDAPQDSIETANESIVTANMSLEDTVSRDSGAGGPIHSNKTHSDELDTKLHQALEDGETEIDEFVMSAFDIGDFDADTYATEEIEANDFTAGDSGSSNFDPDDLELDRLSLEALGFDAQEATEAHCEDDFYGADERLEIADVSLDELVSATEKNFLARWFKRLVGTRAAEPKKTMTDLPEPRLFEADYSQSATQSKSTANYDAEVEVEVEADFYTQDALELGLESASEPSVDDSDALLALVLDKETNGYTVAGKVDSFETLEVCERADGVGEPSESLEVTEEAAPLDASSEPALTDDLIREDKAREAVADVAVEAIVEPHAFDLDTFELDALDGFDADDFDEDSLLEPLGEKAWLNEADNANEALHVAAAAGDLSGVWAALEANASVNALGLTQRTALSTAVEAGHVPVVEMLLEMCADPNLADIVNGSPVRYPLMVAATEAAEPVRDDLLRLLLARGAKVNQLDVMGQTALMGAAEHGHVEAMRLLIEANADLDAQDLLGQTAMLRAKGRGHDGAIALLQEASMDRERAIAFLKAVTQGDLATVEQWLAAGMSANTRVARMSALTQAAAKGKVAIAKRLIDAGADIDYQFYETDPTPLFHAAYRGQLEMVALLLEAGASPHLSSGYPIGALDYAEIGQQSADDATAFEPIVALLATLTTRPN